MQILCVYFPQCNKTLLILIFLVQTESQQNYSLLQQICVLRIKVMCLCFPVKGDTHLLMTCEGNTLHSTWVHLTVCLC